jgi:hypothetical protein
MSILFLLHTPIFCTLLRKPFTLFTFDLREPCPLETFTPLNL